MWNTKINEKYLVKKKRINDLETESTTASRGCKIWLSEASLVSHSLAPGSIVSVSFAAVERILMKQGITLLLRWFSLLVRFESKHSKAWHWCIQAIS
ncbi:hypothetical protein SADUNF_Sadunf16G0029700 [Salix dunnii]|uniref:CI111 double-psi beta barrel domain-containing protein n=1 Tax=Salix dunnii TaxID=1413687 RepID=A0A835JA32_9ROSI|nr:hypothetical protein SADUNF_Sadunf16G0029700 [Salix dunnii]